jgi:hypothetical protein
VDWHPCCLLLHYSMHACMPSATQQMLQLAGTSRPHHALPLPLPAGDARAQEEMLKTVGAMSDSLDFEGLKKAVLPAVHALCLGTTSGGRVECCACCCCHRRRRDGCFCWRQRWAMPYSSRCVCLHLPAAADELFSSSRCGLPCAVLQPRCASARLRP